MSKSFLISVLIVTSTIAVIATGWASSAVVAWVFFAAGVLLPACFPKLIEGESRDLVAFVPLLVFWYHFRHLIYPEGVNDDDTVISIIFVVGPLFVAAVIAGVIHCEVIPRLKSRTPS